MPFNRLLSPLEDPPSGGLEMAILHPSVGGEVDRLRELRGVLPAEGGVSAADAVVLHVVETVGSPGSLELGIVAKAWWQMSSISQEKPV